MPDLGKEEDRVPLLGRLGVLLLEPVGDHLRHALRLLMAE